MLRDISLCLKSIDPFKRNCKWRKVIFYEGYFVVFSIGKLGFGAFQNVGSTTVFFY